MVKLFSPHIEQGVEKPFKAIFMIKSPGIIYVLSRRFLLQSYR
jgi:hypothetical protein